jgi:hypothetical protein
MAERQLPGNLNGDADRLQRVATIRFASLRPFEQRLMLTGVVDP